MDFGSVPAWISGIGTTAAVSVALFYNQATRYKQAADEQKAQANRISGWIDGTISSEGASPRYRIVLLNRSDAPVYGVVVNVVLVQGAGANAGEDLPPGWPRNIVSILPPGRWQVHQEYMGLSMHRHPGVEIGFTDGSGRSWVRRATGLIEPINKSPIEHYQVGLPVPYDGLEPNSFD